MKRFKNILMVVDEPDKAQRAIARAVTLAEENQADLVLLSIQDVSPEQIRLLDELGSADVIEGALIEQQSRKLNAFVEEHYPGKSLIKTKALLGVPFLEVIREVLKNRHDLVMTTAEGGGHPRLWGTTATRLLRKCPCPVWVMPPDEEPRIERILACIDPDYHHPDRDSLNTRIMELSIALADMENAELSILHCFDYLEENMLLGAGQLPVYELNECIENIKEVHENKIRAFLKPFALKDPDEQLHLLKGRARDVVPRFAIEHKMDLIVMGTVCRTGIAGFLMGNTAESVLRHVNCSILAVKPEGFVSPVEAQT